MKNIRVVFAAKQDVQFLSENTDEVFFRKSLK